MKEEMRSRLQILSGALSLGLVSILLCISLVTLACMNKSVAWFAKNDKVGANGMVVTVGSEEDVDVILHSYAVDEINATAHTYTRADVESTVIPTYDPNDINYSAYEEALILIFEISASQNATVSLSISHTTPGDVSLETNNVLSNCLQITEATPNVDKSVMTLTGETQAFVTKGAGSNTLQKSGTLTLWQQSMTAGQKATVCFVMEYNMTFLSHAVQYAPLTVDEMDFSSDIGFTLAVK